MFPDKPRPIILRLGNFNEKRGIIRNAKRLKGKKVFINKDYSKQVRTIPKILWKSSRENRGKADNVFLVFDKPKTNGSTYVWDEQKWQTVILREHVQRSIQPGEEWRRRVENGKAFSIINLNARSIVNKTVDLENILVEHDLFVAKIIEKWLIPSILIVKSFPLGMI